MIAANVQTRDLTAAEKARAAARLMELVTVARGAGEIEIEGKTRDFVGEQMGVTGRQVDRLVSIERKLLPELKALLEDNRLTMRGAFDISTKSEDEQRLILETLSNLDLPHDEPFSVQDVENTMRIVERTEEERDAAIRERDAAVTENERVRVAHEEEITRLEQEREALMTLLDAAKQEAGAEMISTDETSVSEWVAEGSNIETGEAVREAQEALTRARNDAERLQGEIEEARRRQQEQEEAQRKETERMEKRFAEAEKKRNDTAAFGLKIEEIMAALSRLSADADPILRKPKKKLSPHEERISSIRLHLYQMSQMVDAALERIAGTEGANATEEAQEAVQAPEELLGDNAPEIEGTLQEATEGDIRGTMGEESGENIEESGESSI